MERLWQKDPAATPFAIEEYVDFVATFLRRLRPDIAIERLSAEVPPRYLADPARSWHRHEGTPLRHYDIVRLVSQRLAEGC